MTTARERRQTGGEESDDVDAHAPAALKQESFQQFLFNQGQMDRMRGRFQGQCMAGACMGGASKPPEVIRRATAYGNCVLFRNGYEPTIAALRRHVHVTYRLVELAEDAVNWLGEL